MTINRLDRAEKSDELFMWGRRLGVGIDRIGRRTGVLATADPKSHERCQHEAHDEPQTHLAGATGIVKRVLRRAPRRRAHRLAAIARACALQQRTPMQLALASIVSFALLMFSAPRVRADAAGS